MVLSLKRASTWSGATGAPTLRNARQILCARQSQESDWDTGGAEPSTSFRGKLESTSIPQSVRQRVEDAVEALGGRVTVGDVAARAGVPLEVTERALNALAADSEGVLQVSDQGDVLYVLPRNFKAIIRGRSLLLRLEPALAGAKRAGEYVVRVSFGTALVASVVLVSLTVIALLTAASSSDRDDRRSNNYSYGRSPFSTFINLSDLFFYWDPYYYQRRRAYVQSPEGMNFFEAIFSFVFGDGDPNVDYDALRWKQVGQFIQSKGGVVTAEQLAPYLDVTPEDLEKVDGFTNEAYVVPALVRFNGHPEVSGKGDLLYVFPQLQRTGRQQKLARPPGEEAALERRWTFSNASEGQRLGAIALGVVNLVGVLYLGSLLGQPGAAQYLARSSLSFMNSLFPFLQAYASSFFLIPLIRSFFNRRRNQAILARNQARLDALSGQRLAPVRAKIAAAENLATSVVIGDRDLIYSSDRDATAQPADLEGKLFEERLRDRERNRKARQSSAFDTQPSQQYEKLEDY